VFDRLRCASRPSVEQLESRDLLAGNVTAAVVGHVLLIQSSSRGDHVTVLQAGGNIVVEGTPTVTSTPGTTQTIGGITTDTGVQSITPAVIGTFSAGGIKLISIVATGGKDRIEVDGSVAVKNVVIQGGGQDTVYGVAGRDLLTGNLSNDDVHVTIDFGQLLKGRDKPFLQSLDLNSNATFDFSLDLGSYGLQVLAPAVRQLQQATGFLDSLLNFLDQPVPVLSNIADRIGLPGDFTWGGISSSITGSDDVNELRSALNAINGINLGAFNGVIDLGRYRMSGGATPLSHVNLLKEIDPSGGLSQLAGEGVHFDLLEHPDGAFGLLFGQPVGLVSYDLPSINTSLRYQPPPFEYPLPPPLSFIFIKMGYGGGLDFAAGGTATLNSSGLAQGKLLAGFDVSQLYADVSPFFTVTGGAHVGADDLIDFGGVDLTGTVRGDALFTLDGSVGHFHTHHTLGISADAALTVRYKQIIQDIVTNPVGTVVGVLGDVISGNVQQISKTLSADKVLTVFEIKYSNGKFTTSHFAG
jgi:hypothetical protein